MILTPEQRKSLHKLWTRDNQSMSYMDFRRSIAMMSWDNCVLVRWCGMTLGIERDGYTHS